MPVGDNPRNGRAEFASGPKIPGALYFDIDDIAPVMGSKDNPKSLPHMKLGDGSNGDNSQRYSLRLCNK